VYGGYATPDVDGVHCVGATFEQDAPLGMTPQGHEHNLGLLYDALPAYAEGAQVVGGHSAYRAMTQDHLPLVGPMVDVTAYQQGLAGCYTRPDTCPCMQETLLPQLWVSVGHGARGLSSAFLAAEVLTASITQQALPVTREVLYAIHPARTFFRQLGT
jgi:tRNA 5-methylaminomethyl-2-thiouridine biosynthesis bifunctional protein